MEVYNQSSINNTGTAQALIIVEGVCGSLGCLFILTTLIHLIFFEKIRSTYSLVQSQVSESTSFYTIGLNTLNKYGH